MGIEWKLNQLIGLVEGKIVTIGFFPKKIRHGFRCQSSFEPIRWWGESFKGKPTAFNLHEHLSVFGFAFGPFFWPTNKNKNTSKNRKNKNCICTEKSFQALQTLIRTSSHKSWGSCGRSLYSGLASVFQNILCDSLWLMWRSFASPNHPNTRKWYIPSGYD